MDMDKDKGQGQAQGLRTMAKGPWPMTQGPWPMATRDMGQQKLYTEKLNISNVVEIKKMVTVKFVSILQILFSTDTNKLAQFTRGLLATKGYYRSLIKCICILY